MSNELEPNWKWHPIMRFLGGTLGVLFIAVTAFLLYAAFDAVRAGQWKIIAVIVVMCSFLVGVGRLFLLGAWTGEEPVIGRDSDD